MRAAVVVLLLAGCRSPEEDRGARLFRGEEVLAAEIQGQGVPLPGKATRCSNCHDGQAAPVLHRAALLEAVSRRNGPPSRYDEASFCTLLRTGVDPAKVLIPRVMPRYQLDDSQCRALFAFVTGR